MTNDLEFSISRYLDGDLAADERAALESRLAADAEARALFEQHRKIDAALRAMPLPAVQWEALAERISAAVDRADEPVQSYRIGAATAGWLAAAASLLLAAGVAVRVLQTDPVPSTPNTIAAAEPKSIRVIDNTSPTAPSVVVAIKPSDVDPDEPALRRYADDIVTRPSQVLIASSARPAQDIGGNPF